MIKIKSLILFNALSFILQAGLFYSLHFQLIDPNTLSKITDPYNSLLAPPTGMTFKIWGVIYTALAIFCLYHFKMGYTRYEKHPANQDIARMHIFFIVNNLAAAGWLITTSNGNLPASLYLIAVQFITLIKIHQRLNIYKRHRRVRSNICTQFPLSIYPGWLSMVALAGISAYLGLSTALWIVILIGVIVFIALLVMFFRHNIFYGLMIIIGLYGIILKTELLKVDAYDISLTAWIGIGILIMASLIKLIIDFRLKGPSESFHRKAFD